jgi:hypothetical protein
MVIEPGQQQTNKLVIGNLSNSADLDINLRMVDFTYNGNSGVPKLYLAANAPQTTWSLKPFTSMPTDVVVPKGETKTVTYTVKVPKGQGAGSYYSAIVYSTGKTTGGSLNLSASGVTLAFLSVPGIVHENMTVQKLGAYQTKDKGATGGFAYINTIMPMYIGHLLKNEGNVAEAPSGTLKVHDMWGHMVANVSNTNKNGSLAIIGQTRLFLNCIKDAPVLAAQGQQNSQALQNPVCANPHLWPGLFKLDLDVFYGQNGNQTKELTASSTFWYLPWWFIAALIALLIIIVGIIWMIRRKMKKSKGKPKTPNFKAGKG